MYAGRHNEGGTPIVERASEFECCTRRQVNARKRGARHFSLEVDCARTVDTDRACIVEGRSADDERDTVLNVDRPCIGERGRVDIEGADADSGTVGTQIDRTLVDESA